MDVRVLYDVVFPTLTRDEITFFCISSLGDIFSFWNNMLEMRDQDGVKIFNTMVYDLVCKDCKKLGIEDTCKHKMGELPHWQSADQHAKLEIMMRDQLDTFLRETKGYQMDPNIQPVFDKRSVTRLGDMPPYTPITGGSNVVFVAVDPAANGNLSDYAIVSFMFEPDTLNYVVSFFYFLTILCIPCRCATPVAFLEATLSILFLCSPIRKCHRASRDL